MKTRTYNHINDCWAAIHECETLDEVIKTIAQFPNGFGKWYVEKVNDNVRVINEYYDGQLDDWYSDEEDTGIDWTDEDED